VLLHVNRAVCKVESQSNKLAVAKFFKSRVWKNVTEGSTGALIFGDMQISLKHIERGQG